MHVHLGLLHALITFLTIIPIGFFWRWIAMKYSDSPWAQAMAFIY